MSFDLDSAIQISTGAPRLIGKDDPLGTSGGGIIVSIAVRQATEMNGQPRFSGDGKPLNNIVFQVQTDQRDPAIQDDDGVRAFYAKGWGPNALALIEGVRKAGLSSLNDLKPGMGFTATYSGTQPSKLGSPQKLFTYTIDPTITPTADDIDGAIQAPAPQPQATPTVPAPAQQQPAATPAASKDAVASLVAMGATDEQISEQLSVPVAAVRFVRSQLS